MTKRNSGQQDENILEQDVIDGVPFNQTTCGKSAFVRGSNQRTVAFSFFSNVDAEARKKESYCGQLLAAPELSK